MKFDKWNSVDVMPEANTQFIAKVKDYDSFIFGKVLSNDGWLVTTILKDSDPHYWYFLKEKIEYWYDIRKIGQN